MAKEAENKGESPEEGLTENDRQVNTDNYLNEDGICFFPGEDAKKPSKIYIASPFIGFTDLILSLVVKNPEGGIKTVPYSAANTNKVLGIIKDQPVIDLLQESNNGRGILFAHPNDPKAFMTIEEWTDMFKTDPVALVCMMRLYWKSHGGGVQVSRPDTKADTKYTVLGKGGRTVR